MRTSDVITRPAASSGGIARARPSHVERGASGVVTTPAATKVYRSGGNAATQTQRFVVDEAAALEWLPQETIAFDGADVTVSTIVELARRGAVRRLGDPLSRASRGGRDVRARALRQRFEIFREGRPLLIDRALFDGGSPCSARSGASGGVR